MRQIYIGDAAQKHPADAIQGAYVPFLGDTYYKISNFDAMEPFFMAIVSASNHWLFVASTGGLSAGRVNAEQALFPYYTDDKLTENSEHTGSKAILLVTRDDRASVWEPFSQRQQGAYRTERNIYKNVAGTCVVFEEVNHDLGLVYRYAWRTSDGFGFVKTSWLSNAGASACDVELLDGMQNILPANVASATQNTFSSLLDAYKYSELQRDTGLGIFSLSSTLTDLAEPSESLLATTVAQLGLDPVDHLLSSVQLDQFRAGMGVTPETEMRGRRGAYFVHAAIRLAAGAERSWCFIADVGQDSAAIVRLSKKLRGDRQALAREVERDIETNAAALRSLVAGADGLQATNDPLSTAHHFANVMFNWMRGGIFSDQYQVDKHDFIDFVRVRNRAMAGEHASFFEQLPAQFSIMALHARAEESGSDELVRMCAAYLPLSFSRRHGDPSRPWNRFAINLKNPDGSKRLDYEGNWRDIFQNWEALAYSYPEYVEGMLGTFLNATTVDGYNPYRITRNGIDWEVPEPHNPWANIGYWSDHQIIYLQKLMEVSAKLHPGKLQSLLGRPLFSYANVPYRIKRYADLQKDPANTIDFDWSLERDIESRVKQGGTDEKLVRTRAGRVLQVTLVEKLLTLLLAKLANFVPEGGIWMNTQRPEWNDANNALVGKGLSVVTLCYLRRMIVFSRELLSQNASDTFKISAEVHAFCGQVQQVLGQFEGALRGAFSDELRRSVMNGLCQAGSDFRWSYYEHGLSGQLRVLPASDLMTLLDLALKYVDHSLRANRRSDHLYHAYNILHLDGQRASVANLTEMLEGQVAILSSGLLSGDEALALLTSMRNSRLYEPIQHSYILYPDRALPGFLEKNRIPPAQVAGLALVAELTRAADTRLITMDDEGNYHFNGQIRNVKDVARALDALRAYPRYAQLVDADAPKIEALFEATFRHSEFTGRSGTFFAYEGLGSIYWHMVSKLLLAVQEAATRAKGEPCASALAACYADVRKGLGFNKSPAVYGAFPTDPYSHTPKGRGAKQPGMTGMVKEEVLTRQAELGMLVEGGRLKFDFSLLDRNEWLTHAGVYEYEDVHGLPQRLELPAGSLAYSVAQTPVVIQASSANGIRVHRADGSSAWIDGLDLDAASSRHIFERDGIVHHLVVSFAARL